MAGTGIPTLIPAAPALASGGRYVAVTAAALLSLLLLRLILEFGFLLPSPVADSTYFLTASANYCRSGLLATTAFPIDFTGQARMIWHGFLSPMLFGALNLSCDARGYYLILWIIEALTAMGLVLLARRRGFPQLALLGLAAFVLAIQCTAAFRPETLAILLIVGAELSSARGRYLIFGAMLGALLCTQPTVAGLYGLMTLILQGELRVRWRPISLGFALAVTGLFAWYPFPAADLFAGIMLQAKLLMSRSDAGLLWYYLLVPSLPGWSVLFLATIAVVARRKPLVLAMLPAFWFFGPRLPPTYYNLLPSAVLLLIIAIDWSSTRMAHLLSAAALAIGVLGIAVLSARDLLTVQRYGNTFAATRTQVQHLAAEGAWLKAAPAFLALTNPELRTTDPRAQAGAGRGAREVNLYAVNGQPVSPCHGRTPPSLVSLRVGGATLFKSNSGWMVYVCDASTADPR